jgi:hypothetical protein
VLRDISARIERGQLDPSEPTVAPLVEAGRVLRLIAERRAVGKFVHTP